MWPVSLRLPSGRSIVAPDKLDLIARVEARIHAAPTAAPDPGRWPDMSAAADEYRRVVARGDWLEDRSVLVQALTELGGGYWVMTPLARDDGTTVLVNRGFVPADNRNPASWLPQGPRPVTVTGLLRMSEPGGAILRANDPASDRWFSRDVAAIAASRGLAKVAPYFIDAERAPGENGLPVAGLTVIAFSNNHLVYALTWGDFGTDGRGRRDLCQPGPVAARLVQTARRGPA